MHAEVTQKPSFQQAIGGLHYTQVFCVDQQNQLVALQRLAETQFRFGYYRNPTFPDRRYGQYAGQAKKGAGVSGNLDELQGRMLARRRRSRFRSTAVGSLVLVAVVSGLGFAAVLLWHQVGPSRPVASHAASSAQAD